MKYRMITMAVVMGLAACSSGGSGSNVSNNQPSIQPNNPTSSISPTTQTQDPLRNGGDNYLVRVNTTASEHSKHSLSVDKNDFHQIIVNGITLDLRPTTPNNMANINNRWGMYAGGLNGSSHTPAGISKILVSRSSDNVQVGVVSALGMSEDSKKIGHSQDFAFFAGKSTDMAQMPQQGIVKYSVEAMGHTYNKNSVSQGTIGKTDLTVDFSNKTLNGTFEREAERGGNVILNADIKGNQFSSKEGASTAVKGGFYGENAKEIGGVFQNENTIGAFIGKQ